VLLRAVGVGVARVAGGDPARHDDLDGAAERIGDDPHIALGHTV
jgi:hypothetical protein